MFHFASYPDQVRGGCSRISGRYTPNLFFDPDHEDVRGSMLNNCIGYSKEPRFSSAIGICEMSLFAWYYRWLMIGVLFLSPELALAQMSIEDRLAPGQPPVIIVHRAAVGGAPDNSLAGIQNAIDRGIDMVEIDIQITLDGQYIVMHDPVLTTTTNVEDVFPDGSPHRIPHKAGRPHYVEDYTLKEIQQLRLLDEQGGDHPVPSLDEVLHLVDGKLLVIMELKNWEKESLAQLLEDHETDNLLLFQQTRRIIALRLHTSHQAVLPSIL